MTIDVKYRTSATAIGGRDGRAFTDDKRLDLKLATPKEIGGAGGDGTNPEQLFAAGYSACFLSALHLVARSKKLDLPSDTSITANVGIGPNGAGGFGLAIALIADLPGIDRTTAEQLVAAAHQVCPYSNAIRNNVTVDVSVA
ncbi:organic hydroperoxide resistance protein [Cypionkella sp. TWP1-2-1b2]|uniref:organic hydroperoxide resistance protein n=1 Tax=Cypionkella sp. TWP1-2-1b2 TaxID=2804675 RepID=UPI003CFA9479